MTFVILLKRVTKHSNFALHVVNHALLLLQNVYIRMKRIVVGFASNIV